jgi:hypothetical protein
MPTNQNRASLITEGTILFPNNNTQEITPADLRQWLDDGTTSFVTQKDKSTMENAFYEAKSSNISAAGLTDLSSATGNFVHITVAGTPTITSFGVLPTGARFVLVFEGVCTITYNATSLIIPGLANKTTAAGDCCMVISEGSGNWRIVGYFAASGSGGGGTVTSVTGTAPIQSSGGTAPAISIPKATSSVDGYLDNADWTTFNSKQDALSAGTGISIASNTVTNTAPDLTVALNAGAGIGVTGTYPSFTISAVGGSATSTVQHQVKLGVAINKGQAVYVTGADGTNMIVGKASNTSEATSSKTMGLIDASGAANAFVNVITEGLLAGLNTDAAANAGDPVWLGVNGDLIYGLVNKPYAPDHLVFIGIVTRKNALNGEIFVKVQNGFELKELHDVQAQTPSLNDTLYYDNTTSPAQWKTAQINVIAPSASATVTGLVNTSAQEFAGIKTFGNGASAGEIRIKEPSGSGSNSIGIKAQAISSDYDLTLPTTAGTAGYVIQTDGSGNLSWVNNGGGTILQYLRNFTAVTLNTSSTETIVSSILIPANTFAAGQGFMFNAINSYNTAGTSITTYLKINTTNSLSGATQIVSQNIVGSIIQGNISGFFSINSGSPNNSTRWSLLNQSLLSSVILLPTDWSVAQYLIISAVGSTSRPMTFQNASITPL